MKRTSHGYILILTLMIISISVVVVTYITNKATAFIPYSQATVDREKAYMLALGGVQIALSQLAGTEKKEKETISADAGKGAPGKPAAVQGTGGKDAAALLKTLLPVKNRWQTFALQKARDGVNGSIKICIMSEQGKININHLYDFEKLKFVGEGTMDVKKILQIFFSAIEKATGAKDLFAAFEKFLKERQYKLHDVTELLTIKEFEPFKKSVFYEPPEAGQQQETKENRPLYLTDIFTVWSDQSQLEPWLLSDSVSALLGFPRAQQGNAQQPETVEQALKNFKPTAQWQTDWDKTLKLIYEKEYKALPQGVELFFSATFEPTAFSVLSYGKVGKITQKVLAIIERSKNPNKEGIHEVSVKRLFWL